MLDLEDQHMMRRLREEGLSKSDIGRQTGYDRKTVRKYLLTGELKSYKERDTGPSILDPFKEHIATRLAEYPQLSSTRLWEEIQEKGYLGGYTTVKSFVREIKLTHRVIAEYRFETKPGIQAQGDWSELDRIEVDGHVQKLYCFTMVLGYSRMRYVEITLDTKTETFIQCHINAFAYFGGVTKEILYDNTKNVVLIRALRSSDSTWNPLLRTSSGIMDSYPGFVSQVKKEPRQREK